MESKLLNIMDKACEMASKALGVSIRFPKPSKKAWAISALINATVGVASLLGGILSPFKWLFLVSALAFMGSFINYRHAKA